MAQRQPAAAPLLEISHVTRAFAGVVAVDDVSFAVDVGETVSVIGPNGAGKTTLFNLLTGVDQPTHGEIRFVGQQLAGLGPHQYSRLGIARTFQHGRVFGNLSVLDNVLIGAHSRRQVVRSRLPVVNLARELAYALLPPRRVREEEVHLRAEAEALLARFGERLTPRLHQPAYSLSYANRRRVEIARALLLKPRLLLLDEPTAGMNPTETGEMLEFIATLKAQGQTILLIEHKLAMVMELSDRVVVMDDGRVITAGAPGQVRHDPRVIEAYLGHRHHHPEQMPLADAAASNAMRPRLVTDPASVVL